MFILQPKENKQINAERRICIATDECIFNLFYFVNCKRGIDIEVRISEFVVAESNN